MTDESPKKKLAKQLAKLDDHVVLARLQALGLWPEEEGLPPDPIAEVKERVALEQEAAKLRGTALKSADVEKALHAERKRRWEESKARRSAKKKERDVLAKARRAAWDATRKEQIVFLGHGVSAGLGAVPGTGEEPKGDPTLLAKNGLPQIADPHALAALLEMPISRLRFLTFHRRGATVVHYHRFTIPKKTGGVRGISAPKRELGRAQRWVFEHVLARLVPTEHAHGFVTERSTVTNARPHVGRRVVINLDLRDFFPTVTFRRVKGLFSKLGYAESVSTVLALLTTEPPRLAAQLDGALYYIALGDRRLPQGACTSPAITNAICVGLDRRLAGLAKRFEFSYTRYADDLTFSGDDRGAVGRLLGRVRRILVSEGFEEHEDKTRVMSKGSRQEVTGIVVNRGLGIPREEKRELRAILHNAQKHGLDAQNRANRPDFRAYLKGRVAYACMVEPALKESWSEALRLALG